VFPKKILNYNNGRAGEGGGGGGWLFPELYGQKEGAHVSPLCDDMFMIIW